ncbi:YgiQ family radical SAM protein [Thioalkalivibrio sp. HL-Eb18]|uniref:YgiQ family radical SAM protein n=1 Tax=Thioalkalivibrio sp. HL-Eb18 TaxID=1266913 RepID=UPI00037F6C50|nr:YgiQ family radical SAM protein [Thioalkalivibrio sp. HL-Eb18]
MSAVPDFPPSLFAHKPYWAKRFGTAPFLPTTREEMDDLGWDSCDIVLVTGDAYVDHPSFGMAIIGRLLEAQGFRVGIIAQPDWTSAEPFRALGRPNLFFGVTAGNMDSMVNHYTADRKIRSNDAYTPGDVHGHRPDRAVIVYAQRAREAYKDVPVVAGGIEASLRRIAHYDYWQDKVRRSVLLDARADILLFGNAERALVELAHRVAAGEHPREITDLRGTAFLRDAVPAGYVELDSSEVDTPGPVDANPDPYAMVSPSTCAESETKAESEDTAGEGGAQVVRFHRDIPRGTPRDKTVIRIPAFEQVKGDSVLYAHASRVLHLETNPGNARAIVQRHGDKEVWLNPPPIPLTTAEMDAVFDLPYARAPHPSYGDARIPAWEMIRFSVNIMRGCFGGCTFCSITEHEGRIIQSRSEESVLKEIEEIRDKVDGFTGVVSDLGGPTANMYRLACKDPEIERSCRRLSCVYPGICKNLDTDHTPLVNLYRKARALPGIKKILIASGLRYDLAVESPEYVKELVTHHVGGYLKIAPEHTESGPLSRMMKPGMGAYDRFKAMFEKYSKQAGKEQYLIPYFIAAHPGTSDEDMLNLALWLKRNNFRADQVQAFLPSPMALATAMWHSGRDPLRGIKRKAGDRVPVARGARARRLHKAFLRYHDPNNWPLLRDALKRMGRADLIGNGKHHLIPTWQPAGTGQGAGGARAATGGRVTRGGKALKKRGQTFQTQHKGVEVAARPAGPGPKKGPPRAKSRPGKRRPQRP